MTPAESPSPSQAPPSSGAPTPHIPPLSMKSLALSLLLPRGRGEGRVEKDASFVTT